MALRFSAYNAETVRPPENKRVLFEPKSVRNVGSHVRTMLAPRLALFEEREHGKHVLDISVLLTALLEIHTGPVIEPLKGIQSVYMAHLGSPLDPSKPINLIIFDFFWVVIGNMLTSIVSNSRFGKRPGARNMTIFGSHVGAHVSESANSY